MADDDGDGVLGVDAAGPLAPSVKAQSIFWGAAARVVSMPGKSPRRVPPTQSRRRALMQGTFPACG